MTMPSDKSRKALGKGLSALLPAKPYSAPAPPPTEPEHSAAVYQVPIALIDPNPLQPRTVFEPGKLEELASSIRANGIIQPLIVRRKGERYELIAGERRLRAAALAGLSEVPALVQEHTDARMLEVALIENIQREDLNPIETAQAFERLAIEMGLSHEEIGARTGKDRTTVTNLLRLLRLPLQVQVLLAEHRLSMGHARAILALESEEEQIRLAERAAAQGYSVRQVERLVKDATQHRRSANAAEPERSRDPNVSAAVGELEAALGTRVRIVERSADRGKIEIEYYSQDELNRLYELILAAARKGV